MDLTQYKIDKYENGVSNLPDYPSPEEYPAEKLKAVFDSRSDKEIKEKHNELIDALTTAFASVEAHGTDASAHLELFNTFREEISDDMPRNLSELSDDIGFEEVKATAEATRKEVENIAKIDDRIIQHEGDSNNPHNVTAAQMGLDKVDNTPDSEKRVAYANETNRAEEADFASMADNAKNDYNGKVIHETYATKEELNAVSGESMIAESKAYTDDLERRLENNSIDDTYVNWAYFCDDAYTAQCDVNGNDIMETYATKDEVGTLRSNLTGGSVRVAEASYAGNADNAVSAEQDLDGNVIHEHYETKSDASSKLTESKAYTNKLKDDLTGGSVGVKRATYADEASVALTAETATCDDNGNVIHTTYATKEELVKQEQKKPEFANSIEECADSSKLYVLPDGYIYAYMSKYVENKTNEYDPNTAKTNYRINSSGAEKSYNGILLLPLVKVNMANPYTVKITGVTLNLGYSAYVQVHYYSGNTWLGVGTYNSAENFTTFESGNYNFNLYNSSYPNADGVRLQLGIKTEVAITTNDVEKLYVEFVPKTTNGAVTGWHNTGHAFVPADYEDRIIALEEDVEEIKGGMGEENAVPEHWGSAVRAVIASVKDKQAIGGSQCVSFALCSDMHIYDGEGNFAKHIGRISNAVMAECDVPLLLNCGDFMTNDSLPEESYIPSCYDRAWGYLEPIPKEKIMLVQGNHDGAYGAYTSADTSTAYSRNMHPNTLWQYLFRPQSLDFRRVWGENGKYFYVDNIPQKTRFVCLNSHDGEWMGTNEDGTAIFNHMKNSGYTQKQLDFLIDALNVENGWSIILASHIPPTARIAELRNDASRDYSNVRCYDIIRGIVSAYANRTSYIGSRSYDSSKGEGEWANASVSVDFEGAKGVILGWFSGHCHSDNIVTDDLPFPIVTITCAGDFSYDNAEEGRVSGSDNETAVDFVTIDKRTKTVYCTRLGVGDSREYTKG